MLKLKVPLVKIRQIVTVKLNSSLKSETLKLFFQMVFSSVQARSEEVGLSRRARSSDFVHGEGRLKRGRRRRVDPGAGQQEEQGISTVTQQSSCRLWRVLAQPWSKGWEIILKIV